MDFKKILNEVLVNREFSQKQLASLLDCSPATISNWINGTVEPSKDKQLEILKMLDVNPINTVQKTSKMKQTNPTEVAKVMGVSVHTIYKGLQQGVFPWGYAIKTTEHSWTYIINAEKFEDIECLHLM